MFVERFSLPLAATYPYRMPGSRLPFTNSHEINSFADPHPLTLFTSILYKNIGGRVRFRQSNLNLYPACTCFKCKIYRRRSPLHSCTYKMLSAQPLSFDNDPFSWGGCTPFPTSRAPHSVPKTPGVSVSRSKRPHSAQCLCVSVANHQPTSPALPTVTGAIIWVKLKTNNL